MKYIFVVNSFSLKDKTEAFLDRINEVGKKRKLDYKIEVNSLERSTEDILEDYKDQECIMMAVGGDGMINRVLNGIYDTKNILGFVPIGTGNDFYKTNKEDLDQGLNDVDVVKINNKYFVNVVCFGIDADIANESQIIHNKKIPKSQRYNAGILYHFFKYKSRPLTVEVEGKTYSDKYTTVVVCNGKYYGGGYKVGTYSSIIDNKVEVYLVSKMNKFSMARLIMGMKDAKHEKSKKIIKISTDKLVITSEKEVACNMDGEELKDTRFEIEVIPRGLKVYYDQSLIDEFLR